MADAKQPSTSRAIGVHRFSVAVGPFKCSQSFHEEHSQTAPEGKIAPPKGSCRKVPDRGNEREAGRPSLRGDDINGPPDRRPPLGSRF